MNLSILLYILQLQDAAECLLKALEKNDKEAIHRAQDRLNLLKYLEG